MKKNAERLLTKQNFEIHVGLRMEIKLIIAVFIFGGGGGGWQNLIYDLRCTIWA